MPKTGATRYQKFLKSEKSKTKLKGKKELPKGTNVTKTNFKVKKIVIKEQLKKHSETEALSTRKLNVKELLSRLNHFNVHSRTDALDGLKELINNHPQTLEQNLGQLVNGIIPMVLNVEKVIRHESFKVLHLLLSSVSKEKIEPFFDIMSTYLRSSMTHIDSRIQEDSLLFLDILLLTTAEKVARDCHKILPNFLDMISKLRVDSKTGRTLTVNLDSKITSVKWRVKVLQRLQEFLQKYVEHHNINNKENFTNKTHYFDTKSTNTYPLLDETYASVCHISCFSPKNSQEDLLLDEVEKFKSYLETLMPLLFETWLEVCPNVQANKNIETVVSEDAAALLRHILKIISLLWELVQHLNIKNPGSNIVKTFSQNYRQSFTQHMVLAFPYVTNIRSKQSKANLVFETVITDPKLVVENLEICYLFIAFNPKINIKAQSVEVHSVLHYIEKSFNQNTCQDVLANDVITKLLSKVFSKDASGWTKNVSIMDPLFRKIIWTYFNKDMPNVFRQQIFTLLCNIALNDRLSLFHTSDAFEKWLQKLPDILLEDSITIQTVDIIHKFATRSNKKFNSILKPKLISIIKNLVKIKIVDSTNDTSSYHKLFSLVYWIRCWDEESLNLLEQQLLEGEYRGDHGKFIFETLRLKSAGMY